MAEKRRFIDVWIIESNTVYREVPFAVVTDWVQQGRLLPDDRVRPSGTAEWYPIGGMATFAPYIPKMEANRAEDQAEALEPVEIDFAWKRPGEDDDEDVDMIPLIDISLVLLIFFMMTAAVGAGAFDINTPAAKHKNEALAEDMKLWVGVDVKEKKGAPAVADKNRPWYSLGLEDRLLVPPTRDLNTLVAGLRKELGRTRGKVVIRLRADQSLPIEVIKRASVALKNIEYETNKKTPGRVAVVLVGEVSETQ